MADENLGRGRRCHVCRQITSSAPYVSVQGSGLSIYDLLDFTTDPRQISFSFHTKNSGLDGVNFTVADGSSSCLNFSAPGITQVFVGANRVPVNQPFDLNTQSTCP